MSGLKFKAGDVVADGHGLIGQIKAVNPHIGIPYRILESDGGVGSYYEYPTMFLVEDDVTFTAHPIKPIRVYQCKQDCCIVRVPSRRFWYVRTPKGRETFSSFRDATSYAGYVASTVPLEVTA